MKSDAGYMYLVVGIEGLGQQFSNHQAVIQGLICGNETLKGVIGDEDLVEDELNAQIESLKAVNEQMQRSIGTLERCITNLIKTVGYLGLGAVVALATGLSRGFDYFYENNFLNLKDAGNAINKGVEKAKDTLSEIGNAVSRFFSGLGNAFA